MVAERSQVWPHDHIGDIEESDKDPDPAESIRIWISVRNHTSDAGNTSKTMEKVIEAILEFSDLQAEDVEDYVDSVMSLPFFATRYDPDCLGMDKEVYMAFCRRISQQSALISRMPPHLVEATFSGMFDAYKAGTISTYPEGVKQHFDLMINEMVKRIESEGCLLRLDDVGTIPVLLLLDKSVPGSQDDAIAVARKLFLQLARLFSTETNLECYGPMVFGLRCETFGQAEAWLEKVREDFDTR